VCAPTNKWAEGKTGFNSKLKNGIYLFIRPADLKSVLLHN
jgi:hypothetical protein